MPANLPVKTNNKQTIWLSTMMVLSLMLIGYYTVGTPSSNVASKQQPAKSTPGSTPSATPAENAKTSVSDYFITAETNAVNALTAKQQQLESVLNTSKKQEDVQAAQKQMDDLQSLMTKQKDLEDQVVALGYNDAIVTGDSDHIDVMVEADSLDNAAALKIIKLAEQEMPTVSVHNITVGSHK